MAEEVKTQDDESEEVKGYLIDKIFSNLDEKSEQIKKRIEEGGHAQLGALIIETAARAECMAVFLAAYCTVNDRMIKACADRISEMISANNALQKVVVDGLETLTKNQKDQADTLVEKYKELKAWMETLAGDVVRAKGKC